LALNPFVDPVGCRAFIDAGEADFRKKLIEQSEWRILIPQK